MQNLEFDAGRSWPNQREITWPSRTVQRDLRDDFLKYYFCFYYFCSFVFVFFLFFFFVFNFFFLLPFLWLRCRWKNEDPFTFTQRVRTGLAHTIMIELQSYSSSCWCISRHCQDQIWSPCSSLWPPQSGATIHTPVRPNALLPPHWLALLHQHQRCQRINFNMIVTDRHNCFQGSSGLKLQSIVAVLSNEWKWERNRCYDKCHDNRCVGFIELLTRLLSPRKLC